MGASQGEFGGRLRLALLATVAALFVLVPVSQASAAEFTLTVHTVGEGIVECEAGGFPEGECEEEEEYEEGTEITLLAEPEFEWEFLEWTGACAGEPEECELTMDGSKAVTAIFAPEPTEHELTVNATGAGEVECEAEEGPGTCQSTYPNEVEVTLYAVTKSGSEFLGWGGDCSGTEETCVLEMGTNHHVTAAFSGEESGGGGSGGGGSSPSSQPPPSLPSPTVIGPGKAKVAGAGLYKGKGGKATLKISCKGEGACKGTVKLIAKLKVGHETKKVTVGKASFSLPAGASKPLTIKLSGPAKKLLGKGRTLIAKVSGSDVAASTVRIAPTAR